MVDNNVAFNRDNRSGLFEDDDPLAELARIVGYEDKPAVTAPRHETQRVEPEFNLEDELLREFEVYESPRLDPIYEFADEPEPVLESEPAPAFPVSEIGTEAVYPAPLSLDGRDDTADGGTQFVAEPDWHDDLVEPPVADRTVEAGQPTIWDELHHRLESHHTLEPAPLEIPDENLELADELESAIADVEVSPVLSEPVVHPNSADLTRSGSGLRLPLANFHAMRSEPRLTPPVLNTPVVSETTDSLASVHSEPVMGFFPEHDRHDDSAEPGLTEFVSDAATVEPQALAEEPFAAQTSTVVAVEKSAETFSKLDELIYDVERYSMSSDAVSPSHRNDESERLEPPVDALVATAPATSSVDEVKNQPDNFEDSFDDADFELALDDIELDFSDISDVEDNVPPARPAERTDAAPAQVAAPVVAAAAFAPSMVNAYQQSGTYEPSYSERSSIQSRFSSPQQPVHVPAVRQTAAPVGAQEDDFDLPFDPSLISDPQEQPESVNDVDIPALPVEEPVSAQPYRSDYDLDIDTELAALFAQPATGGLDRQRSRQPLSPAEVRSREAAASAAAASAATAKPAASDGLDDFERALEEDFRASLTQPVDKGVFMSNVHVEDRVEELSPVTETRRRWIVPAFAVGAVLLGSGALFAWVSGGSSSDSASSGPVIIAADNEPVKVAPENPGGKTVPNQDKAVYDRVAGATPADPKQSALISTSEQPVDVVQKTLIPESLPLEGDEDIAAGTPVGETEDPRLLPQTEQASPVTGTTEASASVAPRKVRTMLVRPDGTLVAQEVPAEPLVVANNRSRPTDTPSATIGQPQAGAQGAPGAQPATLPVSRVPVGAAQPENAPVGSAATPPATAGRNAGVVTPVPAARPAEQPSNVVATVTDQGRVRPAAQQPATAVQPSTPSQAPVSQNAPVTQTAAASAGDYVIQIASLPSEAEARKTYQSLSGKFGGVIGGRGVDIKSADIAGKGTFYRLRIPAGSKTDAVALCERYRQAGGSCIVAR